CCAASTLTGRRFGCSACVPKASFPMLKCRPVCGAKMTATGHSMKLLMKRLLVLGNWAYSRPGLFRSVLILRGMLNNRGKPEHHVGERREPLVNDEGVGVFRVFPKRFVIFFGLHPDAGRNGQA